ncbi:MAG: 2-dehydro-3-deoxygalactonokinase [Faecousia sp.]
MSYITLDCGTTNSRAYLVTASGEVLGKKARHVGVRNTSMTGSSDYLLGQLRQMIAALRADHPEAEPVEAVFSSGMITSEIGLAELPHLMAPCGLPELAAGMTRIEHLGLTPDEIPVYFVRGVKNRCQAGPEDPFSQLNRLDFMRGEETQIMGLLKQHGCRFPVTVLVLSSHSKYIPVDRDGRILGSLTTASGQAYAAILEGTFVGKSVVRGDKDPPQPEDYFDEGIVKAAMDAVEQVGLMRCLMFPRFLDVLLDSRWYQRKLYFEAAVAADDMLALGGLEQFGSAVSGDFCIIGQPERCRLYARLLREAYPGGEVTILSDTAQVDRLSIDGVLEIAAAAGILLEQEPYQDCEKRR